MSIYVYPHDCTDFSTTGLCGDLQPIEAYFEEEKNGICQIEMTLHYDKNGKWKEVKPGRYLCALVPVRVTPKIENDAYAATIQKIRVKTGTRQTYVTKTKKQVYYYYYDREGVFHEKESKIDPESAVARYLVDYGVAEIRNKDFTAYISVDDYDVIEQLAIPAALDGVETVTGTARLKPQFFIITDVKQTLENVTVTAKHVFYELLQNATTYKTENKVQGAAACRQVFDNLISADDRFEIFSDCTDEQTGLDYDRKSPVQALLDPEEGICARYGLSLIRDNYSIFALKNVGTDRGFVVEYGKNMLSVDCTENIDETYTRIIPFGKDKEGNAVYMDGQKWIDSSRINDYAAPRVLLLDCTDTASVGKDMNLSQVKEELRRRAQEELDNGIDKPDLQMTVDFLSLGDTEEFKQYRDLDKVYMFDRITVKDKVRGYNYTAEVVAVRHNLLTGMLESCTIGSLEKASAARKIASWQVPTVDGGNIRLQSIVPGILGPDAVSTENIQDNAIVAEKLIAGAVTTEKLDAGAVTADKLAAESVTAGKLAADALEVLQAQIGSAEIDFAQIKDLAAGTAIITKGTAGELYISRLAVTEANMVSLTVGQLVVKGEDGGFYALTVDESGGIKTERKQIANDDVTDLSINAGEKLIEGSVTAGTLNAQQIFGETALIQSLIAENLDVSKLFAREATIHALNAADISGNGSLTLTVQSAIDGLEIGGRNLVPDSEGPILGSENSTAYMDVWGDNRGAFVLAADITKEADDPATRTCIECVVYYANGTNVHFYGERDNANAERDGITRRKVLKFETAEGEAVTRFRLRLLSYSSAGDGPRNARAERIKLERGTKATDWTPNPDDTKNAISQIRQEADSISIRVGLVEDNMQIPPEELENSSVTINTEGIEMATTGHFRLYANDGSGSQIKLGGDDTGANFSVDERGAVSARAGDFAEGLTVANSPVWTKKGIIVSATQPQNVSDVVWIQPQAGVQQVNHSLQNTSQAYFPSGTARSYTLSPESSDTLSAGGSYAYSLSLKMTLGTNTNYANRNFTIRAVLESTAGSVTLDSKQFSLKGWESVQLTLTGGSPLNLFASPVDVTASITITAEETGGTYLYIPSGTEITLNSKNTAAAGGAVQSCAIHYIP